jgi:hypothetical protein
LRAVAVTAPVTLSRGLVPLADWVVVLLWVARVREVDRLRPALVLARLRFALEPLARLLPELAARLALGFDALPDRLPVLPGLFRLRDGRVDCAMGSSSFNLGRSGAPPAASAPRRCGR